MFFAVLERSRINPIFCHQFTVSVIESVLQNSLIIFLLFLHKKVSIFRPSVKDASVFDVVVEIYLHAVSMFDRIQKFTIVQFSREIVDDSLIDSLAFLLAKIYTIFEFLDHRVGYIYG